MSQKPEPTYTTNYRIGQDNWRGPGMDLHIPVFPIAALLILVFIVFTLVMPKEANTFFAESKTWVTTYFHWLFVASVNFFVIAFLLIGFSPLGKVRLGGINAKPEFSYLSWFSMLFAAGMGIGLMFWSVAEPVGYYTDWAGAPLNVEPRTPEAQSLALGATMFHWGAHAWAIYGLVALSLAFFTYNKGLPLTLRSSFYPFLGDRVWGWFGHTIDIIAVIATLFGLATSLGFGAQQIASGLHYLFEIPDTVVTQSCIIVFVTFVATISVVRGLHGGVRLLSNLNLIVAIILFVFVAFVGGVLNLGAHLTQIATAYGAHIFELSTWTHRTDTVFYQNWTVFYWAWWIAWSPFVGLFIARVSRGRTVREFVTAVIIVPTVITGFWLANFGGLALDQVNQDIGPLADGISNESLAMFQMLDQLPFAEITSGIAIFLVFIFFVTSSDSGSLVIDSLTAGGKLDAPIPQRIFWAQMEGLVAIALLIGGGTQALSALQTMTILSALPFIFVLFFIVFALITELKKAMPYYQ